MPALIAFVIRHFANGFLLGAAAAIAAILLLPDSPAARLVAASPAGFVLVLFSFGSTFGMGSLATALWFQIADD